MKKPLTAVLAAGFVCLASAVTSAQSQAADDSTGVPGDHFSLEGALQMFKQASSPEEFEKLLNSADNHVNNLDLNGDGEVDYVRVIGKKDGDAHAFVLQVPVSDTESQDIAVIELEKTGESSAVVQIIGDEDIYGEQKIVEPKGEDAETQDDESEGGPSAGSWHAAYIPAPIVVVNVWGWPCVRYVFSPAYVVWVSPWRWGVYPPWWRPWRPLAWRVWHPFRARYHVGFAVVRTHRVVHAHRIYGPHRTVSVTVHRRYAGPVTHYRTTRTVIKTKDGAVKVKTKRTRTVGKKR